MGYTRLNKVDNFIGSVSIEAGSKTFSESSLVLLQRQTQSLQSLVRIVAIQRTTFAPLLSRASSAT